MAIFFTIKICVVQGALFRQEVDIVLSPLRALIYLFNEIFHIPTEIIFF